MSLDRWLPSLSLPSFLPYQLYSKGAGTQRVGGSHAWQDSIRQREGDSDNTYIQYKTQSRYKTERDVEPHGRLFVYAPCKAPYGPRPPSALPCSHQQWRGRGRALHHRLCNMASNEIRSNLHLTKSGDKQKLEEPKWITQRPECFTPHLKRSVCTEWG